MSEVRLNVIDATHAVNGSVHGSIGDAVIASLSAEPETIGELEAALERFNKRYEEQAPFAFFGPGQDTSPWDAGVIVVDLAARIIAVESSYSDPQAQGEVTYHDGNGATDVWLPYRLPSDWLFVSSVDEYESLREKRTTERRAHPLLDIRQVLYGRPLIDFVVSECLAESERLDDVLELPGREESKQTHEHASDRSVANKHGANHEDQTSIESSPELDGDGEVDCIGPDDVLVQSLHARWLITPREDLCNRTPRDVIVEKLDFIDSDLSTREQQWSLLREGPPPLSRESHAYRFGGFGLHEYVIYYDLVRYLLVQCWERVRCDRHATISVLVDWLEATKQAWLNEPGEEFDGRIPSAMIESERRRIPLVLSAKDMLLDDDCELCQMLKSEIDEEDFGPGFWHLDGCNMDSGFEFSDCLTREEWEEEERSRLELYEEFEREWATKHPPTADEIKNYQEGEID